MSHLINLSIISVLKERYRVLATDYTNFAVEYSCSDTSLMSRKGKEIIIILLSNKKCMSATKKQQLSNGLLQRYIQQLPSQSECIHYRIHMYRTFFQFGCKIICIVVVDRLLIEYRKSCVCCFFLYRKHLDTDEKEKTL